jgi:hypothetical protein
MQRTVNIVELPLMPVHRATQETIKAILGSVKGCLITREWFMSRLDTAFHYGCSDEGVAFFKQVRALPKGSFISVEEV